MVVDFIDPAVLVELAGEPGIRDMADEARTRFEMVRDTVATVTEAVAWRQTPPSVTTVSSPDMPA